jgi:hypothetical protein
MAMPSPPSSSASVPPSSHPLGRAAAASADPSAHAITPAHRASLAALAEAALGGPLALGAADALVDLLAAGSAPGSVAAVLGAVCRAVGSR